MNDQLTLNEKLLSIYKDTRDELLHLTDIHGKIGDYAHPVFGEGNSLSKLMLIGEAPGKEEALSGHPFVGKAGRTLDSLLDKAGIKRSEIYLTNAVKYRPLNEKITSSGRVSYSNRTPTNYEIDYFLPVLRAELMLIKPKIVVTLGNTPLKAVWAAICPDKKPPNIGEAHGRFYTLEYKDQNLSFELCPLYHPASSIYNRSLLFVMEEDIAKLKDHTLK